MFFELKLETSFYLLQFSFKKKLYTLHLNADTIGDYAGIAQLVEQRIRNAWVVGSNPILGSLFFAKSRIFTDLPSIAYPWVN